MISSFFFFNDTATTEIYPLSLHDALPIYPADVFGRLELWQPLTYMFLHSGIFHILFNRSEEHTSELQSQSNLVCRLLLEKKKNNVLLRAFYSVLIMSQKTLQSRATFLTSN